MGDYGRIGEGLVNLFELMVVISCVSIPLALWKLADIIAWACEHITVSFGG